MTEDAYSEKRFEEAKRLLYEAAHCLSDNEAAPSDDWWHDFFLFDGSHMILTEEGWISGTEKANTIENEFPIIDEVNAP